MADPGDEPLRLCSVAGSDSGDGRLSTIADREGVSLTTVSSGAAALERLESEARVDCVVSAQDLPDTTGLELLRAVRETDRDLPFFLYPADGSEALVVEAAAAGVTGYLTRSVATPPERLLERLRDAVACYRRRRSIRRDSSMLAALLDEHPDNIFIKDEAGEVIRGSNRPASRGDIHLETPGDERRRGGYEADVRVIETGESIVDRDERVTVTIDGESAGTAWNRTTMVPWRDEEGSIAGLVGISFDISEFKEKERTLRQRQDRLEEFAEYVSREFRNPLLIARGYFDLAVETGDEELLYRTRDALERLDELVTNLLSMTRQILDDPTVTAVRLGTVVEAVWGAERVDGATLRNELPAATWIRADEQHVRLLLEHLFRNSVEHGSTSSQHGSRADDTVEHGSTSPRSQAREDSVEHGSTNSRPRADNSVEHGWTNGRPEADDSVEHGSTSGQRGPRDVEITVGLTGTGFFVEDDGPGIPEGERDAVFEYGYTDGPSGTGLGLALVEEIADRHGWTVSVTDGTGGGARFEFGGCLTAAEPDVVIDDDSGSAVVPSTGTDVGTPATEGRSKFDEEADAWILRGGGHDLWNDVEEFHFRYALVEDDARVVCRVADFEAASEWSKAGAMIRAAPNAGAAFGFVGLSGSNGSEAVWRPASNAPIESRRLDDDATAPRWYRVDRRDDELTSYTSSDGRRWQPVDQRPVPCDDAVAVGIVCCSRHPDRRSTAVFDEVSIRSLGPR